MSVLSVRPGRARVRSRDGDGRHGGAACGLFFSFLVARAGDGGRWIGRFVVGGLEVRVRSDSTGPDLRV